MLPANVVSYIHLTVAVVWQKNNNENCTFSAIGCMWWLHSTSIFLSSVPSFYLLSAQCCRRMWKRKSNTMQIYIFSLSPLRFHSFNFEQLLFVHSLLCWWLSCCKFVSQFRHGREMYNEHWTPASSMETSCVRTTMNVKYSSQFIRLNFRIFLFFNYYSVATFLFTISSHLSPHSSH